MENSIIFKDNGSNWHKWDLHCHTASSYDYEYKANDANELLVDEWQKQKISAIAITDHFRIDEKRITDLRNLITKKKLDITLFPGVELRTDKGGPNIHIILIFDNTSDLKILEEDFNATMLRNKAKPNNYTNENIYWDYNDILEFAKSHNAIISIHTGKKSNGMDDQITNALSTGQAIKSEYAENIDIFEVSNKKDIEGYQKIVFKKIKSRPLIICSDNHNPKNYLFKENLWLKAKLNFEGLKQAIIHCEERVFVGDCPTKIQSVQDNPERYIEEITVKKKEDAVNFDNWFDFSLKMNPGLTTIIGNKGSGKSALADLIGYIGGTDNNSSFSFLSKDRFCKEDKLFNLDYCGKMTWFDNEKLVVNNFDLSNKSDICYVRYLPQRFIEDTCNNLDKRFQIEIDKVIYSYIDKKDREQTTNLSELIEIKEKNLQEKINHLTLDLDEVNKKIIKLERKKQRSYYEEIEKKLRYYEKELDRHNSNKPKEVKKPIDDNKIHEQGLEAIEAFTKKIKELDLCIKSKQEELIRKRKQLKEIDFFLTKVSEYDKLILELKKEAETFNQEFAIEPKLSIDYKYDISGAKIIINNLKDQIIVLEKQLKENYDDISYTIDTDASIIEHDFQNMESLYGKIQILNKRINRAKEMLSKPQKDYQTYLEKKEKWEKKRLSIIGSDTNADSMTYYKNELNYLNNSIDIELDSLKKGRISLVKQIFSCINSKKKILDEIYQPVEKKLDKILQNIDDKVMFKSTTLIDDEFVMTILNQVNQTIQSKFKGKNSGNEYVNSLIRKYKFDDEEEVVLFVCELLESVNENDGKYDSLLKDRLSFYNYVSSLQYLNVVFSLKMGEKNLSQLSPGEKGIVLLIFYLALDKEDLPLIIDQPEDNLDNQSVFKKLVPSVVEAKKNRQVILITHNPNLAIACDSDLVIYCEKDKKMNSIRYESGAIEDTHIRKKMIDILEGTMPAFDLRSDKYKEHFLRKW